MPLRPERLPQVLGFHHVPIWDPGPEWIRERIDESALAKLVELHFEHTKQALQQQIELLDKQQAIINEGMKAH
jgi:hypothetical protein